ncbi:MAG: M28 family peptidase [Planctomycetes bacterium]|nr:M28 family peptidase [Planctomycetota bacterium]
MIRMPGESYRGPLEPLTAAEAAFAAELRRDVVRLASDIGERNVFHHRALEEAALHIEGELQKAGLKVSRQAFSARGKPCWNIEGEVAGGSAAGEIVVIGGHYDSVLGSPGANDNATGAAAVLALARRFAGRKPARTLRFVAFANEEPPFFQTGDMGSLVYARECRRKGESIAAMLSLETLGWYSDARGSQRYPFPFGLLYPSTGNFVAFVGNLGSRALVRRAIGAFREGARFPSEGGALPGLVPGVGFSDHWSFWKAGYPGVMVTDTALFRYPHYHTQRDRPEQVDFDKLARVVAGLEMVIGNLSAAAGGP